MDAGRLLEESSELARHNSLRLASLEQMYDVPAREQSLRDYWHILQKRKWTVVVSIVVVFVVAGIISVRMTPIYDARDDNHDLSASIQSTQHQKQ